MGKIEDYLALGDKDKELSDAWREIQKKAGV